MDELCFLFEKLTLSDVEKRLNKNKVKSEKKKLSKRKRVRCWKCKKLGHKQKNCYQEKIQHKGAGIFKKSNIGPIRVRRKYRKHIDQLQ